MTPQQEDRDVGVGCGKLQAAGRDHRDLARLGNNGSGRSIAHRILDHREQCGIVARLCVDHVGRAEARLFQARGIEVIAEADPQDRRGGRTGFPRGDADKEQGGRRVIDQRAGQRGRFMQGAGAQATGAQAIIQRLYAKRHDPIVGERRRHGAKGINAHLRMR
ncbi:hypothetical protein BV97_05600 [Novosphingobium resinovorum]|uniref:Uncharacterized protein n=1 Tax=Novosphingobium resinovorum TaxID=158500 RepID=A0A031J411_9SPHN|nr:hypothetical protein BV97_05600 [Novosphingobium resinovorum]